VAGDNVEVVESFTYLGVDIHNSGSSEHDIRKRIAIARNCMASDIITRTNLGDDRFRGF